MKYLYKDCPLLICFWTFIACTGVKESGHFHLQKADKTVSQESLVIWNMQTGTIRSLIGGHPEIERQRIRYAVSLENDLIAVSYDHHDLLATYDLEGNLKHYIYGPDWSNVTSDAMIYYYDIG